MDKKDDPMAHPASTSPTALAILETGLYVDDLDAAQAFYVGVLGLEIAGRQDGRHLFLRTGASMLLLFLPDASLDPASGVPAHGARGPGHLAFDVPQASLADWETHLGRHGVAIEQTVQWPNSVGSLYFRDPAGNSLELASAALWSVSDGR